MANKRDYYDVLGLKKGASDDEIKKGITAGISKINIDTRIRMAFTKAAREYLRQNPDEIDPSKAGSDHRNRWPG